MEDLNEIKLETFLRSYFNHMAAEMGPEEAQHQQTC